MRIVSAVGYSEPRDALSHDWGVFSEQVGFLPILIPNSLSKPIDYFRELECSGLILSGGEDWMSGTGKPLGEYGSLRDRTEHLLFQYCMSEKVPLLGVCRGMQVVNMFFGGSTTPEFEAVDRKDKEHLAKRHPVSIHHNARIPELKEGEYWVNSFHENGILPQNLAEKVEVFATARDGSIEGYIHESLPIIGIQWHPEREGSDPELDRLIFKTLFGTEIR